MVKDSYDGNTNMFKSLLSVKNKDRLNISADAGRVPPPDSRHASIDQCLLPDPISKRMSSQSVFAQ